MDVLIRFGFSIEEIKNMMDANGEIDTVSDKDIYDIIEILEKVGCQNQHIKNIFLCNPFVITRNVNDIHHLISKLYELGFTSLFSLLDFNPYLLNISDVELEKMIEDKKKEGLSKEEVFDSIYDTILY